jgi:RNA polymerase sigma-70 factor (ECF subfamily)
MRKASQSPKQPSTAQPSTTQHSTAQPIDPGSWLEKYGDYLYNYALNRLRFHELAEEAVQDTLMSAIRSVQSFQGGSTEQTWLFAILRNKITDILRREWKTKSRVSLDDEANPESTLFDSHGNWQAVAFGRGRCELESREFHEIVMKCIQKLPRNQATIFILKVLHEKKSDEICQDLQISTTNYWARLHRARLSVANCVERNWPVGN